MSLKIDCLTQDLQQAAERLAAACRLYEALWLWEQNLIGPIEFCRRMGVNCTPENADETVCGIRDGEIRLRAAMTGDREPTP